MALAVNQSAVDACRGGTREGESAPAASHRGTPALISARRRMSPWTVRTLLRLGDGAALLAIAPIAAGASDSERVFGDLASFVLAGILLFWSLGAVDVYRLGRVETYGRHLMRVAATCALTGCAVGGTAAFLGGTDALARVAAWVGLSFAVLAVLHTLWWLLVGHWRRQGRLTPNIVVVGATVNAQRLIEQLVAKGQAVVLGVFDDRLARSPADVAGVPVLGDTAALAGHPLLPFVDRVVVTVPSPARSRVDQILQRMATIPNEITLFIDHDDAAARTASASRILDAPLVRLTGAAADERRALVKRAQDLIIGTLALIAALPIFAVVAIAIRLDSAGPVFFRQRRLGFNNEPFRVYKFRSMRADAEADGVVRQVTADDERVTRVGRFIRRTSIDELPQIFNVLRGEMSLVGPRPHAIGMKTGETESARLVAGYARRQRIKPGMTGWAAIHGSRGPVDTVESLQRRVALDIEYIERQSFWLDMRVIVMTLPCLLGDRNQIR